MSYCNPLDVMPVRPCRDNLYIKYLVVRTDEAVYYTVTGGSVHTVFILLFEFFEENFPSVLYF
jgi:hypothetical protein